jgi:NADPH:quinone reductase-like Zn-dependent oxidoreductase
MRAVVLDAPGPPDALNIRDIPIPTPRPGEVLIKVAAFGLNRSELKPASASQSESRSRACSGSRRWVRWPPVRAVSSPLDSR